MLFTLFMLFIIVYIVYIVESTFKFKILFHTNVFYIQRISFTFNAIGAVKHTSKTHNLATAPGEQLGARCFVRGHNRSALRMEPAAFRS